MVWVGTASLPLAAHISTYHVLRPQGLGESPSFLPSPPTFCSQSWPRTCLGSSLPTRPQDSVSGGEGAGIHVSNKCAPPFAPPA